MCFRHRLLGVQVFAPYRDIFKPPLEVVVMTENIAEISPRPIMLVAGANAHSRYYAEDAYAAAQEPKELVIVPDADHVDLYDDKKKIPFEKLAKFFRDHLR